VSFPLKGSCLFVLLPQEYIHIFMSKFALSWTMHMKTDKQGFKDAFNKVVNTRDYKFDLDFGYYTTISGRIYSEISFNIITQKDYKTERLDGTMSEDANGLLLELHFCPSYNRFTFGIMIFIISVILCYAVAGIPLVNDLVEDYFLIGIGTILLPMCVLVYWLAQRIRRITALGMKTGFIGVLNKIENQVELDKRTIQ
jgi:hypothetical protein